ncbi:exonuclease domain-containing protein [Aeromicrobium sp. Leaf350]|uniref:exonuclease domain-containing protein n=1 Tax=Aeromicrobium sp. Leaf350 TaxID=2876565 RepID=UPI001E3CD92B|nr:exonuclease domain-containing protein [Aeromicrobium sp. Leaf350]
MLDFTAIDFETANSYRGSPCSVGLVKVRDGAIVDERHWLIRPPERVAHFEPFNVRLHGITAAMVSGAPAWRDVLPQIVEFIGEDVVVTHNAAFDTGVIRFACVADEIEWPSLTFLCTLVTARRAFALPSYRLPFVVEACGDFAFDHHHALADARAVVHIVLALAGAGGASDVGGIASLHGVRLGAMASGMYEGSASIAAGGGRDLIAAEANPEADPDGYLYGRVVVFTGTLTAMVRQQAWDEVVRAGGRPEENMTKRTNVLVLGSFNPGNLRPGADYSGKAQKAFALQSKGQQIELLTESDFLAVLDSADAIGAASPIVVP